MQSLTQLTDASIYGNVKQQEPMSISDLIKLGSSSLAYKKEKELYEPSIAKARAETETAQTASEAAKAKLSKDYFATAADEANALISDDRLKNINPNDHKSVVAAGDALVNATNRMIQQGVPAPMAHTFTAKYFQMLNDPKQAANVRQEMVNSMQSRVGAQGQASQNLVGAGSQESVDTDPLTGAKTVVSKDRFGRIISQRPLPYAGGAPGGGGATSGGAPAAGGQQGAVGGGSNVLPQGMPMEAYKTEAGKVMTAVSAAPTRLKDINRDINVNDHVLKLLDDPKVMTGPFVKAISEGVKGTNLTPDQQSVEKYLSNLITEGSSKDERENLAKARGSIGTSKKALKDIIKYNTSNLLLEKMETRAVQDAFGDFTNPNIKGAVQKKIEFSKHYDQDVVRFLRATGGKIDGKPVDIEDFNDYAEKLKGYKEKNPGKHSKFREDFEWLKQHYQPGD
jgi:hypothetical protein